VVSPVWLPQGIGTLAIVLFAWSAWLVFGNFVLTCLPRMNHAPTLFLVLFVWAVAISSLNDNHRVREAHDASAVHRELGVQEHFDKWIAARERGRDPKKRYPVVIVAAEGGGIRAAYWTATLLAAIQEKEPRFARHVYAISGVSGGSVGALVFDALLAQGPGAGGRLCDAGGKAEKSLELCAAHVLGEDSCRRRWRPFSFRTWCSAFFLFRWNGSTGRGRSRRRGRTRGGRAWERPPRGALRRAVEGRARLPDPLAPPERHLGGDGPTHDREQSRRRRRHLQRYRRRLLLHRLPDSGEHGGAPLRALHLREPGGSLRKRNAKTAAHVVDGGYFENSGTATALDAISALYAQGEKLKTRFYRRVRQ